MGIATRKAYGQVQTDRPRVPLAADLPSLNILYISQYFPPEACAPAARVDEFARAWAAAGHRVRVLTGFPNHPEGVLHPDYLRRWRHGFVREERDGVEVCRTWLYIAPHRGSWRRSADYA